MNMSIVDYITEEVERQGHNTGALDGLERVGWMIEAWCYAMDRNDNPGHILVIEDVAIIGRFIEREKNELGFRACDVWVGGERCPPPEEVLPRMERLFQHRAGLQPLEFYRELLNIHPFVDGNGRTGKVILNWLNGSLRRPIFPPSDFWGYPIRNP